MDKMGTCRACGERRRIRSVAVNVEWPGGGVRLFELRLCGACACAFLAMLDDGVLTVGATVPMF
jgi:hypothetical protein